MIQRIPEEVENLVRLQEKAPHKMPNIFLISDTHFGHSNVLTFLRDDGTPLRSFSSIEEHDETMVDNWNRVVTKNSKVYHLGDVCMSDKNLSILDRLNGEKVLIKGNHDKAKLSKYIPYFKDVRGSHQLDTFLLTHIPVHRLSIGRWSANIHGHTHYKRVPGHPFGDERPDPVYFNVCVECINYTPISLEEVKSQLKSLT